MEKEEEEKPCDHKMRVEDERCGEEICAQCGLVLTQIFFHNYNIKNDSLAISVHPVKDESTTDEYIKHLCQIFDLEQCYVKETKLLSETLITELAHHKFIYDRKNVAAFVLYGLLQKKKRRLCQEEMDLYEFSFWADTERDELHKLDKFFQLRFVKNDLSNEPSDIIKELCSRLHVGDQNIERADELSKKFLLELLMNKIPYQKRNVEVYSVYHILQENKSAYTIDGIARMANVSAKKLWQLEKIFQEPDTKMNEPEKHVQKLCYFLGFDRRKAFEVIRSSFWKNNKDVLVGCRPLNTAAAILFVYLSKNDDKMSMQSFCKKTNVAQSTMQKLVKKLCT
jgi:transcription initiation factor TFIIIB Brf1 subunit/transcription initiation factor TFIIB